MYGLLADLLVAVHVGYVAFVVVGLLLIVVGWVRGWSWVRNPWFRVPHLIAIGFVALEEAIDMRCPLTVWEEHFRGLAGQEFTGQTFISRMLHSLIFFDGPPWVFTALHVGFAALVFVAFVCCPPRFRRRPLTP